MINVTLKNGRHFAVNKFGVILNMDALTVHDQLFNVTHEMKMRVEAALVKDGRRLKITYHGDKLWTPFGGNVWE